MNLSWASLVAEGAGSRCGMSISSFHIAVMSSMVDDRCSC